MTCCVNMEAALSKEGHKTRWGDPSHVVKDEGAFAIVGCCGACYVATGIQFCPWCGNRIEEGQNG